MTPADWTGGFSSDRLQTFRELVRVHMQKGSLAVDGNVPSRFILAPTVTSSHVGVSYSLRLSAVRADAGKASEPLTERCTHFRGAVSRIVVWRFVVYRVSRYFTVSANITVFVLGSRIVACIIFVTPRSPLYSRHHVDTHPNGWPSGWVQDCGLPRRRF